jgi:histidinol-phosphate aminotransferase/threonine-phosphate decarboxylase
MDPDAVDDLSSSDGSAETSADDAGRGEGEGEGAASAGRVPHGGSTDPLVLDFSANTNPKTPPGVARVYEAALSAARSYPSDDYYEFRAAAAEYAGCEATQVIPTPGALPALRIAIATTVTSGDEVLVPTPSFGEYAREVRLQGGEPEFVPYDELPDVDPSDYALALVCNPNNPTGNSYDPQRLRAYAGRCLDADTPLVVDEAFIGFTRQPSLAGHDGVIVLRSLTKLFGLPGLRAGFAVATGQYRDRLDTARPAWGMGSPAAAVGAHCMRQTEFIAETRERVESERARMHERLSTRFEVHDSDAPFLLLEAESSEAVDDLLEEVRQYDLAVRDARTFRGLDRHVRVAVRLPYENDHLLDALDV